jgi:hypothetical protein
VERASLQVTARPQILMVDFLEMIDMLRKTACAAACIVLACAAGYSLSLLAKSQALTELDLRWLQVSSQQVSSQQVSSAKQDRLPVTPALRGDSVRIFDLPSHGMSIVTREPVTVEGAVRTPPTTVRTVPVRNVPTEEVKKDRLPVGCEPAFSPVTTPAFAHIGVRCDS